MYKVVSISINQCRIMKQTFALVFLLFCLISVNNIYSQNIPIHNFNEFEYRLNHTADSVYFVNFWATWCVPCIKEMPAISKIADKYKNKPLKILLVSLDQPSKIDSRLIPFIKKHNIQSEVILLDDPDFNSWIDKVDPSWSGGIPASLFYSKDSRDFYEQSFKFEELDIIINSKLKQL